MTALRKFLFETSFDDEFIEQAKQQEEKAEEDEEDQEPEEIEPEFKDYHLEIAYDVGFDAGTEEGVHEAAEAIERQISETMTKMLESLTEIFKIQVAANAAIERDAMLTALAVSRKVLPGLAEQNALGEVERMVELALEKIIEEPQVTVRVNAQISEPIAARLQELSNRGDYEGKVLLQTDADLPIGDCRIDWGSGGAMRDMAALWKEIDGIIERNLGVEEAVAEDEPSPEPAPESPPQEREKPATGDEMLIDETDVGGDGPQEGTMDDGPEITDVVKED